MANNHDPHKDDCDGILDSDGLIRRIFRGWIVPDQKKTDGYRLSSQAFEDSRDGTPCSVNVQKAARTLEQMAERFPEHSFALLNAGFARTKEQGVCFHADPDEPGHAYLHGPKRRQILYALADNASYLSGPNRWDVAAPPAPPAPA